VAQVVEHLRSKHEALQRKKKKVVVVLLVKKKKKGINIAVLQWEDVSTF
jgi:hypothetical protein